MCIRDSSVDYSRERFTLDEGLSKAVRKVFVDLYKKGWIYRGEFIINWDPAAVSYTHLDVYKRQIYDCYKNECTRNYPIYRQC